MPERLAADKVGRPADPTAAELDRFLPAFTAGADRLVVELRALRCPRRFGKPITRAGFFELPAREDAFRSAVRSLLSDPAGRPEGVYVTLNPLDPDLLARANNRVKDQYDRGAICA